MKLDNFIKKMDIRIKLTCLLLASFTVIFIENRFSFLIMLGFSFITLLLTKRYKLIIISYFFISLMMAMSVFFIYLMNLAIGKGGLDLLTMVNPFFRVAISFNFLLWLTMSNTNEIFDFLRSIKLPLFITLPIMVMIRFLPSFMQDIFQIRESLKIRGYSLNPAMLTLKPMLSIRIVVMPLLIRALRISENLSIAAELKGLTPYSDLRKKSQKKIKPWEYIFLGGFLISTAVAIINAIFKYYL